MKERIEQLLHDAEQKIRDARSETGLQEVRANILGKQGSRQGCSRNCPDWMRPCARRWGAWSTRQRTNCLPSSTRAARS